MMCEFPVCVRSLLLLGMTRRSHIQRPLESSSKKQKLFLWKQFPSVVRPKMMEVFFFMATVDLRSPFEKVGGLFYLGRMLDKIRLHAKGKLPPDYHSNLGKGFDEKCANFLRINYDQLVEQVNRGRT